MTNRAPIEMIFGKANMKCTRCAAPMGACSCWEKNITLRCPKCKRTMRTHKDPSDPPGTAIVESPCDKCDRGGDKPETLYYDAAGRWFNGTQFVTPAEGSSKGTQDE